MITPREHLSWSSMDLLERDEKRWIRQYLHGEKPHQNRAMVLGSRVADALETGELTGDLDIDLTIEQFPKLEIADKIVLVKLQGKPEVPILAKPDTRSEDFASFREYKTGSVPWTQSRVDSWGQITFYAVAGYIFRGNRLVEDIWLDWAPTIKQADGTIKIEGTVRSFKTVRTTADVLRMMLRMRRAWERIKLLTEKELF